jgi:hypothetical protein
MDVVNGINVSGGLVITLSTSLIISFGTGAVTGTGADTGTDTNTGSAGSGSTGSGSVKQAQRSAETNNGKSNPIEDHVFIDSTFRYISAENTFF